MPGRTTKSKLDGNPKLHVMPERLRSVLQSPEVLGTSNILCIESLVSLCGRWKADAVTVGFGAAALSFNAHNKRQPREIFRRDV